MLDANLAEGSHQRGANVRAVVTDEPEHPRRGRRTEAVDRVVHAVQGWPIVEARQDAKRHRYDHDEKARLHDHRPHLALTWSRTASIEDAQPACRMRGANFRERPRRRSASAGVAASPMKRRS